MSDGHDRGDDRPLQPGLYLVATPIGNLEDITLRALRILRRADRIACEDTRQTQKLLNHFEIRTPTVSYHMHNEGTRTEELVTELKQGARIAVVSDAGTPGIADPGGEMVLMLTLNPAENSSEKKKTSLAGEVSALMKSEGISEMDALKRVARERGIGKSEAYRELQREQNRLR